MIYIVTNEFDELVRLVAAISPGEAVAKAKASITPQELKDIGERQVRRWRQIKETWDYLEKTATPTNPLPPNPYADFDPEDYREIDLEEYNWQVLQEVDPEREVTILKDLYL